MLVIIYVKLVFLFFLYIFSCIVFLYNFILKIFHFVNHQQLLFILTFNKVLSVLYRLKVTGLDSVQELEISLVFISETLYSFFGILTIHSPLIIT